MAPVAVKSAVCSVFFTAGPVHYEDAKKADLFKFSRFHRGMLERGIYLAPSQFEAGFLCSSQKGILTRRWLWRGK